MKNDQTTTIEYEKTTLGQNDTTHAERTIIVKEAAPQSGSIGGKVAAGLGAGILLGSASAWASNKFYSQRAKDGDEYIDSEEEVAEDLDFVDSEPEDIAEEEVAEGIDVVDSEEDDIAYVLEPEQEEYVEEYTSESNNDESTSVGWADNTMAVATTVSDDMSFSEAFSAARAEVGAGGAFEWNGNVYSTYYAEEWNSMSTEEIAEYNSHFNWGADSVDEPANSHNEENLAEEYQADDIIESEPEVEFLGVEQLSINVGGVAIDDQEVFMIDIDNDGVFDVAIADIDGNEELSAEEIVDITEDNLTVDDFILAENSTYDDNVDYDNNVDFNEI